MELAIDCSSYLETLKFGAKYYHKGEEVNPLELLSEQGVTTLRIRLWVHPYDKKGNPYLAGTCDLNNFIELAKYAINYNYKIYLDIHYSDFWVDPVKQFKPKGWENYHKEFLVKRVYQYTLKTLEEIKKNNIDLSMIQIGNEITYGMLWPDGKINQLSDYSYFSELLKAGFKACDELYPNALKVLHLERSYDKDLYDTFFSQMEKYDVKYDVIAASYYPFWHHSFAELFANLEYCKKRFGKEIMIAETSYVFTEKDYMNSDINQLVVNENNLADPYVNNYSFTKEGQAKYVSDFLALCRQHGIMMVTYWEPLWIPANLTSWASDGAIKYIKSDKKTTRNEWSNQCLADYEGNLNPAFFEYKI